MKTISLLFAALGLVCCKDNDQAGDWQKEAKATPLQQRLEDAKGQRRKAAADNVDRAILKLEASNETAKILAALQALAESVLKRQEAEALAGRDASHAVRRSLEQIRESEESMFLEAEKLCERLKDYQPQLEDPTLVDRALANFENLKATR